MKIPYQAKTFIVLSLLPAALFPAWGAGVEFRTPTGTFTVDPAHGNVSKITDAAGRTVLTGSENRYLVMSKAGDATLFERDDKAVKSERGTDGSLTLECTNPKLPELVITKRYWLENNGLRRTLTFTNKGEVVRYVLPMTDMNFADAFRKNVWHLGAGYIGPYLPLPHVEQERPVNEYKQSSKGMVLVNPDGKSGNFSHYRVKINDEVVLPWWHSTIGHYREYADRLYYTPQGYRMGLGTLDVLPKGGPISVTDCFNCFDGDLFTFFDKVYSVDPDIAGEYGRIPPGPKWTEDILCITNMKFLDFVRYLTEMTSEGILIPFTQPFSDWGDYRGKNGFVGYEGGVMTPEEYLAYRKLYADLSPRVYPGAYHIVISTSWYTDILKEHPEWFRRYERNGGDGSLFPGLSANYQSMFNNEGLRNYFVEMLFGFQNFTGNRTIYLDEAQMTNTIDWQRGQLTRDDHTVLFWRAMKKHAAERGVALFYNGSGQPYSDLSYMESPHDMKVERWRTYVGIALGLGLVNRMNPEMRMIPLYWNGQTDYRNRVIALGWIPNPTYPFATDIPTVRNVWQTGNTLPLNVKYTPDWKTDAELTVESYAVQRRKSPDVMLSFINRAKKAADIPVTVDLTTLGLEGRINIWKVSYDYDVTKFQLSDRELRENYRKSGWTQGAAMTRPRLVYSGPAEGVFRDTIAQLPKGEMTTYLFTPAPLAFYSLDDLVQNNFFTISRHGVIKGNQVTADVPCELLLMDRDLEFHEVRCDGKLAECSVLDIQGCTGLRVKIVPGKHEITWQTRPRSAAAAEAPKAAVKVNDIVTEGSREVAIDFNHSTVYTGKTPVTLPEQRVAGNYVVRYPGSAAGTQLRIYGGKGSRVAKPAAAFQPERKFYEKVHVRHGDTLVTAKAAYKGRFEDATGFQRNLDPAIAVADENKLILLAGTTRREGINLHLTSCAGLELSNARQLKLRLSHTFMDVRCYQFGHVRKGGGAPETNFAGIILDYKVKGEYVRRVALSCGLYHPNYNRVEPFWGTGGKPDYVLELGDFINENRVREFSLDLRRFAPENWDGEVFLTLGTARVLPNRHLKLEILEINNDKAGNFLTPEMPRPAGPRVKPDDMTSRFLKRKPKSLKKIDTEEWRSWAKFTFLQPIGFDEQVVLRSRTEGFIAHDREFIYVGVRAYEPSRPPIARRDDPADNERMEFYFERPDRKLFQVVADVKGKHGIYINGMESALEGIVTHVVYTPDVGTDIFLAIPVKCLKIKWDGALVAARCNLCRVRLGQQTEYTVWSPVTRSFSEKARYSRIIFPTE